MKRSREIAERIALEIDTISRQGSERDYIESRLCTITKIVHEMRMLEIDGCVTAVEDYFAQNEFEEGMPIEWFVPLVTDYLAKRKLTSVGAYMSIGEIMQGRRDSDRYVFIYTEDGILMDVVASGDELELVAPLHETIGHHYAEFMPIDVATTMQQCFERLLANRDPQSMTFSVPYGEDDVRTFIATFRLSTANHVIVERRKAVALGIDAAVSSAMAPQHDDA